MDLWARRHAAAAMLSFAGIVAHLALRFGIVRDVVGVDVPLLAVLVAVGAPLVARLVWRAGHGEFGSDHLAAVSIVASVLLNEYLAGAIVVLMLAGGATLEQFAVAQATSVLRALAKRVPTLAHRRRETGLEEVPIGRASCRERV